MSGKKNSQKHPWAGRGGGEPPGWAGSVQKDQGGGTAMGPTKGKGGYGGKPWSVASSVNGASQASTREQRTFVYKNLPPSQDDSDDDSGYLSDDMDGSDDGSLQYGGLYARFLECAENWSMEEIKEGIFHCPICRNKPNSGTRYTALQKLIQHAMDYKKHRFGAHQEFAGIMRGWMEKVQLSTAGGFGNAPRERWVGPEDAEVEELESRDVVWPPMVLLRNTDLYLDDDKWVGMGNQELREKFKKFNMVNSEHAYGPQGHRGMSMLVFESTPAGYMEADALARKFANNGTGRTEWERLPPKTVFRDPNAKHILYGYLADAGDVEFFNKHRKDKDKLKFKLRKYGEAVVRPMRKVEEKRKELQKSHQRALAAIEEREVLSKTNKELVRKNRLRDDEIMTHQKMIEDLQTRHKEEIRSLEAFYAEEIETINDNWAKDTDTVTKKKEAAVSEAKQRLINVCSERDSARKKTWVPGMDTLDELTLPEKLQSELKAVMQQAEVTQEELLQYGQQLKTLLEDQHARKQEFRTRKYDEELALEKQMDEERRALLGKLAAEGDKPGFAKGVDVMSSTDFGN